MSPGDYDGWVIGLNIPSYLDKLGMLTTDLSKAQVWATQQEARAVADGLELHKGLEYFVDPIRDGKIVPIADRAGAA